MIENKRYLTEQKVLTVLMEQDDLMDVQDRCRMAHEIALKLHPEPKPVTVVRKVTENERKILSILAESYSPDEWGAYAFDSLSRQTKLDLKDVRRACRSLAKKGLAAFERVLWNEDGPAGAGYRATEEGAALINPCDLCLNRATYDYWVNEKGEKAHWDMQDKHCHIRECDDHYKQSSKTGQSTLL